MIDPRVCGEVINQTYLLHRRARSKLDDSTDIFSSRLSELATTVRAGIGTAARPADRLDEPLRFGAGKSGG